MKRIILLLAGMIVAISMAFAQQGNGKANRTPEEKATKRSEKLTQVLGLSADQKQKVYTMIVENATKIEAIRAQGGDKKTMHQQIRPIRESFDTQLKGILTPEQTTKWEQFKAEQKAKRQAKKGKGGKTPTSTGKEEDHDDLD